MGSQQLIVVITVGSFIFTKSVTFVGEFINQADAVTHWMPLELPKKTINEN